MKELVAYLARSLVDEPSAVVVEEKGTPEDLLLCLHVGQNDLGKVIGKKGRTAKAMRTFLNAVAMRQKARISLEIMEPHKKQAQEVVASNTLEEKLDKNTESAQIHE